MFDMENSNNLDNNVLNDKLKNYFEGRIVRKDLTKKIKEGANVPVYVLEYLLGKYCSSDESLIDDGVDTVKSILRDNYVRPDESQIIISKLRELGSYSVIDKVSVKLDYRSDVYLATFSNLGLKDIPIDEYYPKKYERLLGGNIWCMINFEYLHEDDYSYNPFQIKQLLPIQIPSLDMDEILNNRKLFNKDEWIEILLRSCGMEPRKFNKREKMLLLTRLLPLVENNFNLCELGPRSTGKSHIYKEISPNSILVSGGQTTVANLFYNMNSKTIGLVGTWDCIAFDEVAGIKFKDKDGIAIMKDYMASGSFSRGRDEKNASASMVFVGNINQSVESLLKTSNLFAPFPKEMASDTAFFDRMHCYNPGWEIPKYRPDFFTDDYGLITDYLAEFLREMRKTSFSDALDEYFRLGRDLNQRDVTAVRKMISGYVKLIYPDGNYSKENIEELVILSLEMRRRVKEQLKKIGGMEFFDINFSYIDNETLEEKYVTVEEESIDSIIPESILQAGHLYTVGNTYDGEQIGIYKIESNITSGNGKFKCTNIGSKKEVKESVETAYNYLKSNGNKISNKINTANVDYLMEVQDINHVGMTKELSLATLIALCSVTLQKPVNSSMIVLGSISIGGTINKIEFLAKTLQVCLDSGAKKILIPMSASADFASVPPELISKFTIFFYNSPEEAVFKALGVN